MPSNLPAGVDEGMVERAARSLQVLAAETLHLRQDEAILLARTALTAALGDTHVVVKREPTPEMRRAGVDADDQRTGNETCAHIYRAMIAAATSGEGGGE